MKLGNLRQARRSEMTAASISHAPLPPLPEFAARSPRPPRPGGPRPGGRRLLRLLTVIMAIGGSLMLVDGGLTLLWQEPVSALYAHFAQDRLNGDLRALDRSPPSAAERQALAAQSGPGPRMALLARQLQSTARTGSAVGQIHIPHIAANFVVVAGTDVAALRKGPGIYAQTSFPGMPGTVAIAGHRTTYLAPFRRINELVKGNRISIDMPYGRFTYVVQRHRIVAPTQVSVLSSVAGINQLVLTACHPLYSAAKRWVVFASLVSSEPRGAALGSAPVPSVPTPTPAPAQPSAPDLSAGAMLLGNAQHASPPALVPGQARASDLLFGLRLPATPHPASHLTSAVHQPPTKPATPPGSLARLPVSTRGARSTPPTPTPTPTPTPRRVSSNSSAPVRSHDPAPAAPPAQSNAPQRQARVQGGPGGAAPVVGVPQHGGSTSAGSAPTTLVGGG